MLSIVFVVGLGLTIYNLILDNNHKSINFKNTFYERLQYFRNDGLLVVAVFKDGTEEMIFKSSSEKITLEYFENIQEGFNDYLDKVKLNIDSRITF